MRDLRDGWQEFTARRWVWTVVLAAMVVNAASVGGVQALGPAIADATFGRAAWGLVLAVQVLGALLTGLLAMRFSPRRPLLTGVAGLLLVAGPTFALAERAPLWGALATMFLRGAALEQFGIGWEASLQTHVPADRLARVYSCDALGSFLAVPAGQMAVGPLAARFGDCPTLLAAAGLSVLALLVPLCDRALRRLTAVPAAA